MKFFLRFIAMAVIAIPTLCAAATFTPNKGLPQPTVGDDSNVWGTLLNQGSSILDANLGAVANVSVAGNANVTATATQAQALTQRLTGTLTGNISYILPAVGSFYIIDNETTGSFGITVASSGGGGGVNVPQNSAMLVYSDGVNMFPATGPRVPSPSMSGTQAFGSSGTWTAPAGVTKVWGRGWGAGGGGGGASGPNSVAGSGGGGGYCEGIFPVIPNVTYAVTVGTGGAGGGVGLSGAAGGATSFSSFFTANGGGGGGGAVGGITLTVGAGGTCTGGPPIAIPGTSGGSGFQGGTTFVSGVGGSTTGFTGAPVGASSGTVAQNGHGGLAIGTGSTGGIAGGGGGGGAAGLLVLRW